MDLQRALYRICTTVQILPLCLGFLILPAIAGASQSRRPELIREEDEAKAAGEMEPAVKEPDPIQSDKNLKVGDFYYKKKNYAAAIGRYLEEIEFQPDSARAYDALARAYEKNDEHEKAAAAYKEFLEKYPSSPRSKEFRDKLARLEKKVQ